MKNNSDTISAIICYAVIVYRNIKDIPFPSKLRTEEGRDLAEKISESFLKNTKYKFKKVNLWQESKEKCILLLENLIINEETYKNRKFSTLLLTENKSIVILINGENHINIISKHKYLNLQDLYKISDELLNGVLKDFEFEYDDNLGYLTADINKIGTAVKTANSVHLPILNKTGEINEVIEKYKKEGIILNDIFIDNIENVGNIYSIENKITLGVTTEEIFSDIDAITRQIMMRERKARKALLESDPNEIYDWIFRAKAILMNARKITYKEVLENISMIRLGLEMKVMEDVNCNQLNEITLISKYNSITNEENDNTEANVQRANYVREVFKNI